MSSAKLPASSVAKRQHYVPRLILRRFSVEPGADNPSIWRLDKDSGKPARTHISNEAVIGHYYRLEQTKKLPASWAEEALSRVEADAATPIRKLVDGEPLSPLERGQVAFFLHVQHQRTPLARQWSADRQARLAELQMQVSLGDRERVLEKMRSFDESMSDEEIEERRAETIEGLRTGTIVAEASQDHEVAGIFLVGDRIASIIGEQMSWCSLRAAPGTSFICSDHPVHIYDRSAPPDVGVGWLSSPATEVTIPLDQRVCLLLRPGPPTWVSLQADAEAVDDLNLRTYASARWSIYGPSQQVVQRVREMAKRDRVTVRAYEPRGPLIVLFESWEGESRPRSVRVHRPPAERPRRRPKR